MPPHTVPQRLWLLALALPLAACSTIKPLRALAPEAMGLTCSDRGVCVDQVERLAQAEALTADAVAFVQARLGPMAQPPRVLFCASADCAKAFGFTSQGAYTVGSHAIVVGPRGWQPHFVRHELIHHLQVERWGSLRTWLVKPDWLVEGMAYSLSDDPRRPLPAPLQGWREQFEAWQGGIGHDLWTAADKV